METIINQITASQGLSAVAVVALGALLFCLILCFFIGGAFDKIEKLQSKVDKLILSNNEQEDTIQLLKSSHSELNKKFLREAVGVSSEYEKAVEKINELEKEFSELKDKIKTLAKGGVELYDAKEKFENTIENFNQRFEQLEGVFEQTKEFSKRQEEIDEACSSVLKLISEMLNQGSEEKNKTKPASKNLTPKTHKGNTPSDLQGVARIKQPKFKVGSKVKTNKENFYGVVIQRLVENNKYFYLVKNKLTQRWYSESTLRNQ